MLKLAQMQVGEWSRKNFGDQPAEWRLLGATEELGELCHGYLKLLQGIRGDEQKHRDECADAVGDIIIYLLDFCERAGFDADLCLYNAWKQVRERDWKANRETGGNE